MGRRYSTPPDTNEKEKIVGGILNFQQTMFLVLGVGIGAIFFFLFYFLINIYFGTFFLLLFSFGAGPLMAFYHIDGYSLDEFLLLSFHHNKHGRKLPYLRNVG